MVSDDAAVPAMAPPAAERDVDAHGAAGDSSVTSDSFECTFTLSSISTSTLSSTSLSSDSSDDNPVAWLEADREFLPHVPSESDDCQLATEEDDASELHGASPSSVTARDPLKQNLDFHRGVPYIQATDSGTLHWRASSILGFKRGGWPAKRSIIR